MSRKVSYLIEKNSHKKLQYIRNNNIAGFNEPEFFHYVGNIICQTLKNMPKEPGKEYTVTYDDLYQSVFKNMKKDWGIEIIKNEKGNGKNDPPEGFENFSRNIVTLKVTKFITTYIKVPEHGTVEDRSTMLIKLKPNSDEEIDKNFHKNNQRVKRRAPSSLENFIQKIKTSITDQFPSIEEYHPPQIDVDATLSNSSSYASNPPSVTSNHPFIAIPKATRPSKVLPQQNQAPHEEPSEFGPQLGNPQRDYNRDLIIPTAVKVTNSPQSPQNEALLHDNETWLKQIKLASDVQNTTSPKRALPSIEVVTCTPVHSDAPPFQPIGSAFKKIKTSSTVYDQSQRNNYNFLSPPNTMDQTCTTKTVPPQNEERGKRLS